MKPFTKLFMILFGMLSGSVGLFLILAAVTESFAGFVLGFFVMLTFVIVIRNLPIIE